MRQIMVSTGVFAQIWAQRLPGEETEDAILQRLLGAKESSPQAVEARERSVTMPVKWRDDVRRALELLDGEAHLSEIYEKVRSIRMAARRSLPPSTNAIIRRELEYNSSDSESFTGNFDWFTAHKGIGAGVWALRAG